MSGEPWTPVEDRAILAPDALGRLGEVAAGLGRTVQSARDRRFLLNKKWRDRRCKNPLVEEWLSKEDGVLIAVGRLYPRRLPAHSVDGLTSLFPGRTPEAVTARLSMLRGEK